MDSLMAITKEDADFLTDFVKAKEIHTVLEFGSGVSTKVFDKLGVKVTSFETMPEIANIVARTLKWSEIRLWDGKSDIDVPKCDMAFVDGPEGGENRETAYRLAVGSGCRHIACHDADRTYEKAWIEQYLKDWKLVVENQKTQIYSRE